MQYLLSFPYWLQGLLTLGMVAFLTWLNARGTKYGAWTQNVTTFLKVGFLLLLLLGPLLVGKWQTNNLQPLMPATWDFSFWKSVGLAMMLVYWPYDGWINIGPVAEEIRDPQRNIPRGLVWGLAIVTLVYVGTITGYHLSMPMAQVAGSETIASDVFGALFGPWGIPLAAMGVMFSTFGALNSNLLAGPRIYFALARDGLLPRYLQEVHPVHQTPAKAIWTQGIWAMAQVVVIFCISTSAGQIFDYMTDLVVLAGTLFYMLTVSAVIMLRFKEPSLPRPYACWGYPFTPWIYLLGSTAVLLSGTLPQVIAVAVLMLLGLLLAPWLKSSQS